MRESERADRCKPDKRPLPLPCKHSSNKRKPKSPENIKELNHEDCVGLFLAPGGQREMKASMVLRKLIEISWSPYFSRRDSVLQSHTLTHPDFPELPKPSLFTSLMDSRGSPRHPCPMASVVWGQCTPSPISGTSHLTALISKRK